MSRKRHDRQNKVNQSRARKALRRKRCAQTKEGTKPRKSRTLILFEGEPLKFDEYGEIIPPGPCIHKRQGNEPISIYQLTKENMSGVRNEIPPEELQLVSRLLEVEDTQVLLYTPEPFATMLNARGQVFSKALRVDPGHMLAGHEDAVRLWAHNMGRYELATGYAFSSAIQMWLRHNFVVEGGRVVQASPRHQHHFGVVLEPEEAYRFSLEQLSPEEHDKAAAEFAKRYPDLKPTPPAAGRTKPRGAA